MAAESQVTDEEWIRLLGTRGPGHEAAVRRLHEVMLRGARHQVARMYNRLPKLGSVWIEDIVQQAADEATVAALAKLSTFEGRSRFSTWAYKFGILHAAVEVRRNMWKHWEISLDPEPLMQDEGSSPEQVAEADDFAAAVSRAIDSELSPHQRTVALALLVDQVPIDVLTARLGTTRNALYKTLHDARVKLRKHLTAMGYLTATPSSKADI